MCGVSIKTAYMVGRFADLRFRLVLEVWSLGPVERDGASCLVREMHKHSISRLSDAYHQWVVHHCFNSPEQMKPLHCCTALSALFPHSWQHGPQNRCLHTHKHKLAASKSHTNKLFMFNSSGLCEMMCSDLKSLNTVLHGNRVNTVCVCVCLHRCSMTV